jgi:hypothetical protein
VLPCGPVETPLWRHLSDFGDGWGEGELGEVLFVASLLVLDSLFLLVESVRPVGSSFESEGFAEEAVAESIGSTVSCSFRMSAFVSPTPSTLATSSTDLKGRAAIIAFAVSSVIPGKRCNMAASAVFRLIFSTERLLLALGVAGVAGDAGLAGSAACEKGAASEIAATPINQVKEFFIAYGRP